MLWLWRLLGLRRDRLRRGLLRHRLVDRRHLLLHGLRLNRLLLHGLDRLLRHLLLRHHLRHR
ncbi:MAG TPA: hypothetical protein VFU73_13295 [Actinocrinis sp.]|nr:hypothetical protein [Actinocrinis sp.]